MKGDRRSGVLLALGVVVVVVVVVVALSLRGEAWGEAEALSP